MTDNGLPCLDLLEATPGILRGLMSELTDDDARWKPARDRFSVAEVLAHLSHSEGHCYRMRIDRFLAETRPTFEPDDAQMYLELYRDADPEDAFDHFEEQREANVEYLRDLPSEAGDRVAMHREAGQITLKPDAPRMGASRSGSCPTDCRTGASQKSTCKAPVHWKQLPPENRKRCLIDWLG
jgi:hypothetical protein